LNLILKSQSSAEPDFGISFIFWNSVLGYWLLVIGYWFLEFGIWNLVLGSCLPAAGREFGAWNSGFQLDLF